MSEQHDDVIRIASGNLVQIELYQQTLREAGIVSRVAGQDLEGSFGTALPNSIELYVREADRAQAEVLLSELEEERSRSQKLPAVEEE